MTELHFDFRDILKAPRLAWSLRKMHVAVRGIAIAWLLYIIMTYISLILTEVGQSAGFFTLFRYFEFFPWLPPSFGASWHYILYGAGIILALFTLLSTATALARITFEDVRGNDIFQAAEALQFARMHRSTVVVSICILLGIACAVPVSLVGWGLIGRLPVVGPVLFGISSIPVIFWGLFGIAMIAVSIAGFHLVPAIVASLGEDVLETLIQSFSTVFSRPCRSLMPEITAYGVVAASTGILAAISIKAMLGTVFLCGQLFGGAFDELYTIALYRIPGAVDFTLYTQRLFDYVPVLHPPNLTATISTCLSVRIAGWLTGLGGLFVLLWVLSYGLSCFSASQLLTYLVIRKHRDGKDLRLKHDNSDFVPETPPGMNDTL